MFLSIEVYEQEGVSTVYGTTLHGGCKKQKQKTKTKTNKQTKPQLIYSALCPWPCNPQGLSTLSVSGPYFHFNLQESHLILISSFDSQLKTTLKFKPNVALVRAGFGLFHLLLYFEELVLKYHDQDPYNNQLAAVQSQNKQACINMIKPGSVVYWEVTLFLNYIVRVWPLSLMLLNNLQWFSMNI